MNEPHIDAALRQAEILADDYDDYDTDAALQRVARLSAGPLPGPHTPLAVPVPATSPVPPTRPVAPAPPAPPGTGARTGSETGIDDGPPVPYAAGADPRPAPFGSEQAAHDLNLAATLIVDAPQAAAGLARLLDQDRIEPAGALVFAALLHLAGYREASQFWWQFAAGGGDATAAFCLFLVHQARAEFRDAKYWRAQSRKLARSGPGGGGRITPGHALAPGPGPGGPAGLSGLAPGGSGGAGRGTKAGVPRHLLPESVRHELISRCRHGGKPSLPPRLQALIHSLPVESTDEDFGDIPHPDDRLTTTLPQGPSRHEERLR
ncbi:glycoprotein [Streptomyces sp. NPDC004609]|uniref:glycoprotein n=1 Tax=Streptomyces sp. NPDC004609 TaxID=3364704 RepID=UPI0036CBE772